MVAENDAVGSLQADIDFHTFIYQLSGNSLIVDTMRLHWHHLRRATIHVLRNPGMSTSVWREHKKILEAMMAGDVEDASRLMRRHLVEALERNGKALP
jgi:DNA-binding FadR family transcriptional regulator